MTNTPNAANKDLYNFSDLSDLPREIARKLTTRSESTKAAEYAAIVNEAPLPKLSITQIMAVAIRKFGAANVPGQQSIRGYLNAAHEAGLISKPSRQFYGKKGGPDVTDSD